MKSCPFCAEEIQDAAIKCKHCGELLASSGQLQVIEKPGQLQRRTKAELVIEKKSLSAGATGAFLGFGCGVWISGAMGLLGFLLCATGIGAILGLPMILAAVIFLVASPFIGGATQMIQKSLWRGPCPCCSLALDVPVELKGANCVACAKRFTIEAGDSTSTSFFLEAPP